MHSEPLVSAIMPTRGRSEWAQDAVRMFFAQTWANKELVVIDDAEDPSFPQGINRDGVKYCSVVPMTIGEKRNLAVSCARGQIIVHWDSDDRYSPDRIAHQVALLIEKGVDLVGYNEMRFFEETWWKYHVSPGHPIGVSFCYWRKLWEQRPFAAKQVGEDNAFSEGRRVYCCDAEHRIAARVHSGNTSDKRSAIDKNPAQWEKIA